MGEARKPVQVWARLSSAIRDLPVQDPEAILILLSDFIIGNPIFILHDQQRIKVTSSSTLNHKCIFHELDFDVSCSFSVLKNDLKAIFYLFKRKRFEFFNHFYKFF